MPLPAPNDDNAIAALMAENERLRAALNTIARNVERGRWEMPESIALYAREALKQKSV